VECRGQLKNAFKMFPRKPERGKLCGRYGQRCYYNINIDLKEMGWGSKNFTHILEEEPVAGSCGHYN
jgi:hypothetical protein